MTNQNSTKLKVVTKRYPKLQEQILEYLEEVNDEKVEKIEIFEFDLETFILVKQDSDIRFFMVMAQSKLQEEFPDYEYDENAIPIESVSSEDYYAVPIGTTANPFEDED